MNCRGLRDMFYCFPKTFMLQLPATFHCLLCIKHCIQSTMYYFSWGILRNNPIEFKYKCGVCLGGDSKTHRQESRDRDRKGKAANTWYHQQASTVGALSIAWEILGPVWNLHLSLFKPKRQGAKIFICQSYQSLLESCSCGPGRP